MNKVLFKDPFANNHLPPKDEKKFIFIAAHSDKVHVLML